MRALSGLTAAFLLASAGAAFAQMYGYAPASAAESDTSGQAFAGLRGSLAFAGTVHTTVPTATPTTLRAQEDAGGGGSFYVGARLPYGLRLEAEGLYRKLPLSSLSLGGAATTATGYTSVAAPMVNLLWDIPVTGFPVQPFIGGGVGGAYVKTSIHNMTGDTYLHSNNWNFAYELIGGAEIPLSQGSRFTAMYRWMGMDNVTYACGVSGTPGLACKSSLNSQSVDLGLEMDL